ncbi:MAG: hypothetical protein ACI4UM_04605 [Succinivibrio sp.]
MSVILIMLLFIAIVMTALNPRYSMFVFPDSVSVTTFQAFLGWFGWINLFVSLPFLWDGDFENGIYPFFLGAVPLTVAFYLVLKENDNPSVIYNPDARIYLTKDKQLTTPATFDYGFMHGYKKRISALGPKLFFRELFAREKAFTELADSFVCEDSKTVENKLRALPWVVDGAVDIRAQYIFTLRYMMRSSQLPKISRDLFGFVENSAKIAANLGIGIDQIPYPIAKFLAFCNALEVVRNEKASLYYVIEQDDFVCEEDENVIMVFSGNLITEKMLKWSFLVKIFNRFSLNLSKDAYTLIITDRQIVQLTQGHSFKRSGFDMSLSLEDRYLCLDGKNVIPFDREQADMYMMALRIVSENMSKHS